MYPCPACNRDVSEDWAICPACGKVLRDEAPVVQQSVERVQQSVESFHDISPPRGDLDPSHLTPEELERARPSVKRQRGFIPFYVGLIGFATFSYFAIVSSGLGPLFFGARSPASSPFPYSVDYVYLTLIFLAIAMAGGYLVATDPRNCVNCGHLHEIQRICGARRGRGLGRGREPCSYLDYVPKKNRIRQRSPTDSSKA